MVLFYLSNLIGYIRILSLYFSLQFYTQPLKFMTLYIVSYALDAIDGPVARALHQTSKLGEVLDMITDRISTAVLLALLGPQWLKYIMLDISSHWVHMIASQLVNIKHKEDKWLSYYYYKPTLFTVCLCSEAYLCSVYLSTKISWFIIPKYLETILWLIFMLKQSISCVHLGKGIQILLKHDNPIKYK